MLDLRLMAVKFSIINDDEVIATILEPDDIKACLNRKEEGNHGGTCHMPEESQD